MRLKYSILLCGVMLFFSVILTGCVSKEMKAEELQKQLPKEIVTTVINDVEMKAEVQSFEIVERITNKFKGTDSVFCAVVIANEYCQYTRFVNLNYHYENKEWYLSEWSYCGEDIVEVFIQPPLSENQLKNMLPDEICVVNINGEEIKLDIVSFEIEKRKTDLNGKKDISYCAITMENEYYRYTKYLHLTYSYYDIKGGWLLDDWEYYNDAEYVVVQNPLTDDIFKNAIGDWDTIEDISSEFHMESNSVIYQAEVSKINTYNVYAGTVWLEFFFNGNEWNIGVSSNDVEKKWNIIGTYYPVEGTAQLSSLTLQITDFDPESMVASGVVTVRGYKHYDWSDPLDERYFFDSVIFKDPYNSGYITVQTETEKTIFWIQIHENEAWVVYGNWSGRVSRNEG